jgi:subtilase family serine protease
MYLAGLLLIVTSIATYPLLASGRGQPGAPSTASATAFLSTAEPVPLQTSPGIVRLPGNTLDLAQYTLLPRDPQAATQLLSITVTLKRSNQAGLDAYLDSFSDQSSPNYQHFLNPQELADRFGPTEEAYAMVLGYLQDAGFELTEGSNDRLTLTLRGTRQTAERAFQININDYRSGDRTFYANDNNPGVPVDIAPYILAISGLNDLGLPKSPHGRFFSDYF